MTRLFEKEYGLPVNSKPTDPRSRVRTFRMAALCSPIIASVSTDCTPRTGTLVERLQLSHRSPSPRTEIILRTRDTLGEALVAHMHEERIVVFGESPRGESVIGRVIDCFRIRPLGETPTINARVVVSTGISGYREIRPHHEISSPQKPSLTDCVVSINVLLRVVCGVCVKAQSRFFNQSFRCG